MKQMRYTVVEYNAQLNAREVGWHRTLEAAKARVDRIAADGGRARVDLNVGEFNPRTKTFECLSSSPNLYERPTALRVPGDMRVEPSASGEEDRWDVVVGGSLRGSNLDRFGVERFLEETEKRHGVHVVRPW